MQKSLSQIANFLKTEIHNNSNQEVLINKITTSSQDCDRGTLFVAIRGSAHDGHKYVADAFARGASAALVLDKNSLGNNLGLVVFDTRQALSQLASYFYDQPIKDLTSIAITGTNGKTTTCWMIHNLLAQLGFKSLRIGTIGIQSSDYKINLESNLTTPDPLTLHKCLYEFKNNGGKYVVMEASSHALDQARVDDLEFSAGVYTNLTRDHLDYHQTFDRYFEAKMKLFELIKRANRQNRVAVINMDDAWGDKAWRKAKGLGLFCLTYGQDATFKIENFEQSFVGSKFDLSFHGKKHQIKNKFIGLHNAYNVSAAIACLIGLGFEAEEVIKQVELIPQVPGRLEAVGNDKIGVFVDYAHTPDALENVSKALKALVKNKLWIVFGCGGDRDKGKRPQMAAIASKYADFAVVTSDNPRTEDPDKIIEDILSQGSKAEIIEADRRQAIYMTLEKAQKGDVVLIAGKGHEDYQIIGTEKIHLKDTEIVEDYWKSLSGY